MASNGGRRTRRRATAPAALTAVLLLTGCGAPTGAAGPRQSAAPEGTVVTGVDTGLGSAATRGPSHAPSPAGKPQPGTAATATSLARPTPSRSPTVRPTPGTPAMTTSAGPAAPTSTSIQWTTRVDPARRTGWVSCASWFTASSGSFLEGPRQYIDGNPKTITCNRSGLQPKTSYRARLKWWDAKTGGTLLYKSNTVDQVTAAA